MAIPRYYIQFTEPNKYFACGWKSAWQVFDRDMLDRQGGVMAIALCVTKAKAQEICDALNKANG